MQGGDIHHTAHFNVGYLFFSYYFFKAFLPLCTIFKFYHINAEKSLSTDFSPHF
ncbi:hypothetical protein [Spiroplasma ixodetis]|uniref:hypothetical protein n=1 Tax=Spiroplasma ixodetis TaxID=2141 RepID=UPI0025784223|nr:hypothetical protein [Spiroplasma ixodetis]